MIPEGVTRTDLVVRLHGADGRLIRVHDTNGAYYPLRFVLLFPFGDAGWSPKCIPRRARAPRNGSDGEGGEGSGGEESGREGGDGDARAVTARGPRKFVTHQEWVRFHLHDRADAPDSPANAPGKFTEYALRCGRLFEEFLCDAEATIVLERLRWVATHQDDLRAELYQGVMDATGHDANMSAHHIGKRIVLPASITGSPRDRHARCQDAMAVSRVCGKPTLFITMTCNPEWEDITSVLRPGETAADRPDIVQRVFALRVADLLDAVVKKRAFGKVIAYDYVIEWQKRGLPHMHLLLWLAPSDVPRTTEDFDRLVCAEIPVDSESTRTLRVLVLKFNIHTPCNVNGTPIVNGNKRQPCCERTNQCEKRFPKDFTRETVEEEDGYPRYRRRAPADGGQTATITRGNTVLNVDNSWVVPYNPALTLRYECHINVEIVCKITSPKYLHKYFRKQADSVQTAVADDPIVVNEIEEYVNSRYLSSHEAAWNVYGLPTRQLMPNVVRLEARHAKEVCTPPPHAAACDAIPIGGGSTPRLSSPPSPCSLGSSCHAGAPAERGARHVPRQ